MSIVTRFFCILALLFGTLTLQAQDKLLTDFSANDVENSWITVNDNVMGGKSIGGPNFTKNRLIFSGSTNTDGGGFSSIRTKPTDLGLGDYEGLIIRARGSERKFQFDMGVDGRVSRRRTAFRAEFKPSAKWQEIRIPFTKFAPTFFGQILRGPKAPVLNLARVKTMGLFIYDKIDGPFILEVDWIKAYRTVAKQSPKPDSLIPNEDKPKYLGFLSGRFGIHTPSIDMAKNLGVTTKSDSKDEERNTLELRVVVDGFDSIANLEFLKMYSPIVFRSQMYSDLKFLQATAGSHNLLDLAKRNPKGCRLLSVLSAAVWAEVDRVSPGTTYTVAKKMKTGTYNDLKSVRDFVMKRSSIDLGGMIDGKTAVTYLKRSFGSAES